MNPKSMTLLTLSVLLLAGCGNAGSSTSAPTSDPATDSSVSPASSDTSSTASSEDKSIYTIDPETVEEFSEGSTAGQLIDIDMNCFLAEDTTYECRFVPKSLDPTIRVTSSNPESLTIEEHPSGGSYFNVVAHEPGDSLLSIYDVNDMLVYRHIARVRKAYTQDTIEEALFDYDTYGGLTAFGGTYRMTFVGTGPLYGILQGSDEVERGIDIEFTAEYSGYVPSFDMYAYDLTIVKANEGSQTRITSLLISRTADQLVLYYWTGQEEAWLDSFYPHSLKDLHPDIA